MEKACPRCETVKDLDQFGRHKGRLDGRQPICLICQRAKDRLYYSTQTPAQREARRTKKEARRLANGIEIWKYLLKHPCIGCGEADPIVLQFDHRDQETKMGEIGIIRSSWSWCRILEEIEKCDIRCANCHTRRTAKQLGYYKFLDFMVFNEREEDGNPLLSGSRDTRFDSGALDQRVLVHW